MVFARSTEGSQALPLHFLFVLNLKLILPNDEDLFWRLKDVLGIKSVRLIPFTDKNDSHKASKSEISQSTKLLPLAKKKLTSNPQPGLIRTEFCSFIFLSV